MNLLNNYFNFKQKQKGFAALTAAIIISTILLVMMAGTAGIAWRGRFAALDYENKKISVALAQACVQTAILELAQNPAYLGNEIIAVGADRFCKICPIQKSSFYMYMINSRAAYGNTYTNLTVKIISDGSNFDPVSWEETANGACALN